MNRKLKRILRPGWSSLESLLIIIGVIVAFIHQDMTLQNLVINYWYLYIPLYLCVLKTLSTDKCGCR